ncbi:MAG: FkbM family methyltransferase [Alphaproteobacteria bacterium]|nr:FkbM family methyltransferase [Alphaproteobacteria bacterium]
MIHPFPIWFSRQRWLPYKTRRSLLKLICPQMLKDYAFTCDFYGEGLGLRFSGNIVNYIDRLVYFCGAHEKYMLRFLQEYVVRLRAARQSLVYVDVGANSGNHTIFMSRLVDRVVAFEPFERVRNQLKENLALNNITNVTLHEFALGERDEQLPFYTAPETNLGAASFQPHHRTDNTLLGVLEVRKGDDVLCDIAGISIIKIDVEGFEKQVLSGLRQTIARYRPLLIVELTPTTRDSIGDEVTFRALFPDRYCFYYFAAGCKDSGRYRLAPYRYGMTPKIEDVIACPEEMLSVLEEVWVPPSL